MAQMIDYVSEDGKNWHVAAAHIVALYQAASDYTPTLLLSSGFTLRLQTPPSLAAYKTPWLSARTATGLTSMSQTIDYTTPDGFAYTVAVEYIVATYEATDGTTTVHLVDGSTIQVGGTYSSASSTYGTSRASAGLP